MQIIPDACLGHLLAYEEHVSVAVSSMTICGITVLHTDKNLLVCQLVNENNTTIKIC
jgi:hypothetical protein